jgi:hypothetical protein
MIMIKPYCESRKAFLLSLFRPLFVNRFPPSPPYQFSLFYVSVVSAVLLRLVLTDIMKAQSEDTMELSNIYFVFLVDFLTAVTYQHLSTSPRAPVVQAPSIPDQSKARPAGEFEVSDVPDYRALHRTVSLNYLFFTFRCLKAVAGLRIPKIMLKIDGRLVEHESV